MIKIQFQVAILALVSLLAIYFANCCSAPLRDLDSLLQNQKPALLFVEEVNPDAYEEWVNLFVENQVRQSP